MTNTNIGKLHERLWGHGVRTPTPRQNFELLYWVAKGALRPPSGHFVELGTFRGFSAMIITQAIRDGGSETHLTTVDKYALDPEGEKRTRANFQVCGYGGGRINLHVGDDLEYIRSLPDESIKFLFVDSWHDYRHVESTLQLAFLKMMPTGIICGDDYLPQEMGVVRAVEGFRQKHSKSLAGFNVYFSFWWTMKKHKEWA